MNGTPRIVGPWAALALALLTLGKSAASAQVVEYYHLDALGSVRAVTNQAGQVVERHDYLPFGEECTTGPCAGNPAGTNTFKFTAKERDAESGLDYFGARYYSAGLGRFTNPDPALGSAKPGNPQSWSRYSYALNRPLTFVDPSGLDPVSAAQCAGNSACISFPVRVILDTAAKLYGRDGQLLPKYQALLDAQIADARDVYGTTGIYLDVEMSRARRPQKTADKTPPGLNVILTDKEGFPVSYAAGSQLVNGSPWSVLNEQAAEPTDLSHEMAHLLKGDLNIRWGLFGNLIANAIADVTNGLELSGYRGGGAFSQLYIVSHYGAFELEVRKGARQWSKDPE